MSPPDEVLVSVVVPTYNGEAFVRRTLDSVLAQTHTPMELIVCDDGSSDGTLDILRGYGHRLQLVEGEHGGVSVARNTAAERARGELLAFLDQDDVWDPHMLATQVDHMQRHPEWGLVYSDSLLIDDADRVRGRRASFLDYAEGRVFPDLIRGNFIPIETAVLRTEIFRQLGGFNAGLYYLEDYDLFLRLAHGHPIGFCPDALARYRIHGRNLSHDIEAVLQEWTRVLEGLPEAVGDLDGAERACIAQQIGRRYGELAWQTLRRLDIAAVDEWIRRAGPACPRLLALRVRAFRALLSALPDAWGRTVVSWLPRRRLYGVSTREPNEAAGPGVARLRTRRP